MNADILSNNTPDHSNPKPHTRNVLKKRLFAESSPPRAFIHIDEQEASMMKPVPKSTMTSESKKQPASASISLVKEAAPMKLKISIGKKKNSVVGVSTSKACKKPAITARTSTSMDAAASSRLNSARYPVP